MQRWDVIDDKGHEDWHHPQAWAANTVSLFPLPLPCREVLIITITSRPLSTASTACSVSATWGVARTLKPRFFLPVRWVCITPGCFMDHRGCDWSCAGVLQKPGAPKCNRGSHSQNHCLTVGSFTMRLDPSPSKKRNLSLSSEFI